MGQENVDFENVPLEYQELELGDNVYCVNCKTELPKETKFRCSVCGKRIKFRFLSARLQSQIISLWISFPLTVIFFFFTVSGGIIGGFPDEIWSLFGLIMQFLMYLYGIKWIVQEFRLKRRYWWKIVSGLLIFILELYFVVFSVAYVFAVFFY